MDFVSREDKPPQQENIPIEGSCCKNCVATSCLCGVCCVSSISLTLNCIQGVCNMFAACFGACSETCKGCSTCIEQVDCDGK